MQLKINKIPQNLKIAFALFLSLLITVFVSNNFFAVSSPRINLEKIVTFLASFETVQPTPTPIFIQPSVTPQQQVIFPSPRPTIKLQQPTQTVKPTSQPTPSPTPAPTNAPAISCPTTSNQSYSSLRQNNKLNFDPATSPETNLYMRGWYTVNESKGLISRNGNNYGLDPNMPPQISTLFTNHYPKIIQTYRINAWDYTNNHNLPGESATPAYNVHMLGLEAVPGEPLVGLKAGQAIDGTNVFHVQYATANYILFIHGAGEDDGYPYYFLDICVDPNLLAAYNKDNAAGRNQLPVIATGQIFGYAASNEVKFVIRDSGSFMDTRYKEDWWTYGQ